ncbi:MAG: restriction endonuclease [Desulfomonilia bacterium]
MMDPKHLNDLTPQEFEKLVADLLAASGYTDIRITDGPGDKGVDIIAKHDNELTAIQVKHKAHLRSEEIERFVEKYFADKSTPRSLVFVTSADLPSSVKDIRDRLPSDYRFQLLGREDVLRLLSTNSSVANRYFDLVKQRLSSQRVQFILGTLGVLVSVLSLLLALHGILFPVKAPLDERIQTVEKALTNIRDLETYLGKIKTDLVEKQKAAQIINERYAQAKELEKLTQTQLDALRFTLQAQSWRGTLFNYIMGFILGIASSFVATVLYAKWRQRRALE